MSWVDEISLNAPSVSHPWKRVTPGPENTLQREKCPHYPLPARQLAQVLLEPPLHPAEPSSPELPASTRNCFKHGSLGWTWALQSRHSKWTLKTQCICNLRPSYCQHVLTKKNFFSLAACKMILQSNPHNFIPWCFSLTDNIENLIDVGLRMPFQFSFT